jgi:hypothetical protein
MAGFRASAVRYVAPGMSRRMSKPF